MNPIFKKKEKQLTDKIDFEKHGLSIMDFSMLWKMWKVRGSMKTCTCHKSDEARLLLDWILSHKTHWDSVSEAYLHRSIDLNQYDDLFKSNLQMHYIPTLTGPYFHNFSFSFHFPFLYLHRGKISCSNYSLFKILFFNCFFLTMCLFF